mmetsp:Transcript_18759/g.34017  ORF Transcript_18759/g.34017 Transcript_18759/m.34017 type:complete len:236 (+) Transcript_18759:367-1074(+)
MMMVLTITLTLTLALALRLTLTLSRTLEHTCRRSCWTHRRRSAARKYSFYPPTKYSKHSTRCACYLFCYSLFAPWNCSRYSPSSLACPPTNPMAPTQMARNTTTSFRPPTQPTTPTPHNNNSSGLGRTLTTPTWPSRHLASMWPPWGSRRPRRTRHVWPSSTSTASSWPAFRGTHTTTCSVSRHRRTDSRPTTEIQIQTIKTTMMMLHLHLLLLLTTPTMLTSRGTFTHRRFLEF